MTAIGIRNLITVMAQYSEAEYEKNAAAESVECQLQETQSQESHEPDQTQASPKEQKQSDDGVVRPPSTCTWRVNEKAEQRDPMRLLTMQGSTSLD